MMETQRLNQSWPTPSQTQIAGRDAWSVFGVPLDIETLESAEAKIRAAVRDGRRLSFVTPNLNWLLRARDDIKTLDQIREADLSLADGATVVWLAKQLGVPLQARVTGSDLFERLRRKVPGEKPLRVFFFGGRPGAAEAANNALNASPGGLVGCGALNPGYGDVEAMGAPVIFETINAARPDFVVVALGAAKGQDWISKFQNRLSAPVIAHLGAVVDFTAGTIPRAPAWMGRAGLEWAYRIYAEPSLWARYRRDGRKFVALVLGALQFLKRDMNHMKSAGPADVQLDISQVKALLHIKGDLCTGDLDGFKLAVQRALDSGLPVGVDASELGQINPAALGTLGLLVAQLRQRELAFQLIGLNPVHRDIFTTQGIMDDAGSTD